MQDSTTVSNQNLCELILFWFVVPVFGEMHCLDLTLKKMKNNLCHLYFSLDDSKS